MRESEHKTHPESHRQHQNPSVLDVALRLFYIVDKVRYFRASNPIQDRMNTMECDEK